MSETSRAVAEAEERQPGAATAAGPREQIEAAMLRACGELGYRATSVRAVLERCDSHRAEFYRHFANKADCYAVAHATRAERLATAILDAAAAAGNWNDGLAASLAVLNGYLQDDEAEARGLLVAVHVARGPALARHREILERLARALDSARLEPGSRPTLPPLTATFLVSAIESAAIGCLTGDGANRFEQMMPSLRQMMGATYFRPGEAPEP